ncbi:MAG: hypothetical protein LBC18_15800 [Opitutaceae bacterium]|nr:hypothetical protein [Opitutaceae bacterium]
MAMPAVRMPAVRMFSVRVFAVRMVAAPALLAAVVPVRTAPVTRITRLAVPVRITHTGVSVTLVVVNVTLVAVSVMFAIMSVKFAVSVAPTSVSATPVSIPVPVLALHALPRVFVPLPKTRRGLATLLRHLRDRALPGHIATRHPVRIRHTAVPVVESRECLRQPASQQGLVHLAQRGDFDRALLRIHPDRLQPRLLPQKPRQCLAPCVRFFPVGQRILIHAARYPACPRTGKPSSRRSPISMEAARNAHRRAGGMPDRRDAYKN